MGVISTIGLIAGLGISGWMILTGNYPPRLGLLRRIFRIKRPGLRPAFAPSGNWVKITGGIFFLLILFMILCKIGVFNVSAGLVIVVFSTLNVLGIVSIVVSFIMSSK